MEVATRAGKEDKRIQELEIEIESKLADAKSLENQAVNFIKKCGGISDPAEIENFSKRSKEKKMPKKSTFLITKEYIDKGLTLSDIAKERGLTTGTISGHIPKIKDTFPGTDISRFRPDDKIMVLLKATHDKLIAENNRDNFQQNGSLSSKALFDAMGGEVSYQDIKLGMAFLSQ